MKRIRFAWLAALIPPVCLFVIVWKFEQAIAGPRLDHALIAAIARDDAPETIRLLEYGANPNAADAPPAPSFWRWLMRRWRGEPIPAGNYPAALKIAVERDMTPFAGEFAVWYDNPDLPNPSCFAIIKALHDAGAKPAADLTEREKLLSPPDAPTGDAADFPNGSYIRFGSCEGARDKAQFLIENGMSARAYAQLAKNCARLNAWEWADHAYRIARLWNPNDAKLANAARQAEETLRVRRAIQQTLPAKCVVEITRPYPNEGGGKQWAVLYSQPEPLKKSPEEDSGPTEPIAYHCALYREDAGQFTALFRSKETVSGQEQALYVLPLTGRRLPEIIGYARDEMAGASPARMIAYAPEGKDWSLVLNVGSNQGVWLERARSEKAYLVRNGYETGSIMCHADQPRRCDVYAFNGKQYVFADPKYPDLFHEYIKEAEEALRIYPGDTDLPYHLACCYTFTGQKRKAAFYWRRAQRSGYMNSMGKKETGAQNGDKDPMIDSQGHRLLPTNSY